MPKKEKDYFMNITTTTANSRPALLSLAGGLSLFIAFIFVQSLFFKFTNSYETQFIFGSLAGWSGFTWFGTYGGYLIGTAEFNAAGQMIGTDGGLLFGMACLIWVSTVVLVVRDSRQPQGRSGGSDTQNGGAV